MGCPWLRDCALPLGKGPVATFLRVPFPLARLGLAAGLATAWVRALGEFGIVLIIAVIVQARTEGIVSVAERLFGRRKGKR